MSRARAGEPAGPAAGERAWQKQRLAHTSDAPGIQRRDPGVGRQAQSGAGTSPWFPAPAHRPLRAGVAVPAVVVGRAAGRLATDPGPSCFYCQPGAREAGQAGAEEPEPGAALSPAGLVAARWRAGAFPGPERPRCSPGLSHCGAVSPTASRPATGMSARLLRTLPPRPGRGTVFEVSVAIHSGKRRLQVTGVSQPPRLGDMRVRMFYEACP